MKKISSLLEFEKIAQELPVFSQVQLPLETIIEGVPWKEVDFNSRDRNFIYATFKVAGTEYYLSLWQAANGDERYGLSLWRGRPRAKGNLVKDYTGDDRIRELFMSLRKN